MKRNLIVLAIALVVSLCGVAHAVDYTWDGNTGTAGVQEGAGTWNLTDTNRWTNDGGTTYVAWTDSSGAIFGAAAGTATAPYTVTLGSPITVSSILFQYPNAAQYTIAGSATNYLTFADGATVTRTAAGTSNTSNQVISAPMSLLGTLTLKNLSGSRGSNNNKALYLTGQITGATGTKLVVDSTSATNLAETIISADNRTTFFGAFELRNGWLSANNVGALGDVNTAADFYAGTFHPGAANIAKPLNIHGNISFSFWGGIALDSRIALDSGTTISVGTGGNAPSFTGVISGDGGIATATSGTTIFTGTSANTYTGLTTVQGNTTLNKVNAGTGLVAIPGNVTLGDASGTDVLTYSASDQIADTSIVTIRGTGAAVGILRLNGNSDTIGGLVSYASGQGIVENTHASAASTLTLGAASGINTYSGIIRNQSSAGGMALNLVKSGGSTQVFDAAGTYTFSGTTTVSGGTLTFNGTTPSAKITVTGGTYNGTGTIRFTDGDLITVGAAGTFDASGMKFDLMNLSAIDPVTLLNYTSGGTFTAPGTLSSLLTTASASAWSLTNSSGLLVASPVIAYAWTVDANGNWNDAANWVTGVPNSVGGAANFLDKITAPRTVTVDSPVTVGIIKFNNANKYTVSGTSTITLDGSGSGHAAILNTSGSHEIAAPIALNDMADITVTPVDQTLTVSGNISSGIAGTGITKLGNGNLLLSGTNTFDGPLAVNAGKVTLGGTSPLNATTPIVGSVALGATLDLNGTTSTFATMANNGTILVNNGSMTVNSGGVGGLSGPGTVNVLTWMTDSVMPANTAFTGNLILTKNLGNGAVKGLTGNTLGAGATITLTTGAAIVGGTDRLVTVQGNAGFFSYGGNPAFTTGTTLQNDAILSVDTGGNNITAGNIAGQGSVNMTGNNVHTLAGINAFTGALVVTGNGAATNAGSLLLNGTVDAASGVYVKNGTALTLGASERIADTSTVNLIGNASFALGGFSESITSLVMDSLFAGDPAVYAGSVVNTGTGGILYTTALTWGGVTYGNGQYYASTDNPFVSGTGFINVGDLPNVTWNVDADGTWTTAANWTPNGPSAFAQPTFGSVITAPRTVTVDANSSVNQITFNSAQKYTLAGTNTLTLAGSASVNVVQGTHEIAVPLAGTGGLKKIGVGELVLSGNNSGLSGDITVGTLTTSAGTLTVASNTALGTGNLVIGGKATAGTDIGLGASTLKFVGARTIANNVSLGGAVTIAGDAPVELTGAVTVGGTYLNATAPQTTFSGTMTSASGFHLRGTGDVVFSGTMTLGSDLDIGGFDPNWGTNTNWYAYSGKVTFAGTNHIAAGAAGNWSYIGDTAGAGRSVITAVIASDTAFVAGDRDIGFLPGVTLEAANGPHTITANARIGSITFAGSEQLSFTSAALDGAGNTTWTVNATAPVNFLSIGGAGNLIKEGPGTINVAGTLAYTGGTTTVNAGKLAVFRLRSNPLVINGGTVEVRALTASDPFTTDDTVSIFDATSTLTINSGKLDLKSNSMIVKAGDLAAIQAQVKSGYASGAWTGDGIVTSAGVAGTGLGVDTAGHLGLTTFAGQEVAPEDVLVKYTWMGDADFNGVVNFSDFLKLQAGYGKADQTWTNGDFNYDGSVNFSDFLLLQAAYGKPAVSETVAPVSVPEPATLSLLALGGLALLRRRSSKA